MTKKTLLIVFLILSIFKGFAQPRLEGRLVIDMKTGQINCDFILSNLPEITEYAILLNKGMNIKYFKDTKGSLINYDGFYDGIIKGEAVQYTFSDQGNTLPPTFKVTYSGSFPVYVGEYKAFDFKGVIAFNEQTLRATEQTKWYPVIYDISNDRLIQDYTYDLKVEIINGNTVFVNGSAPKKGNRLHFESEKAWPLLLFAGSYDFLENHGDYILNTSITNEFANKIFQNIDLIKNRLAQIMGKSFSDRIYLINHKALSKRKRRSSWGFNTYPSFAFSGLDFNGVVDEKGKFSMDNCKYFGHEFAHNYFGNNVNSGKLGWFWLESFAEYLSFNIVEDLYGEDQLKQVLLSLIEYIQDDTFVPLDKIQKKEEVNEKYRYIVGPLLLQCFEDQFGRDRTNKVLQNLLRYAETNTLSLPLWKESALQSGISEIAFESFQEQYVFHQDFKEHIMEEIVKKYN